MSDLNLDPANLRRLLTFLVARLTPADFAIVQRLLCTAAAWQQADPEDNRLSH